jgi:hypothetical protein
MTKELKIILGSVVLCIAGGIFLDCGVKMTGTTLLGLGIVGVVVGPLAVQF